MRDHDHLNEKYRGAAHSKCNLKARKINFIPIYFYNRSKFDVHLIFEKLVEGFIARGITPRILPKSQEEYITIQVGCLKIMDAYRFLAPASLENIGLMLKVTECNILNSRHLKAVKGIFPYDYIKMDTDLSEIDHIMSETSLPSHADFYSKLKQEALLYTDYKTAHSN